MPSDIFVDTSGFYACLNQSDDKHEQAATLLAKSAKRRRRFVTTDYLLDETATLLRARGHANLVETLFDIALRSSVCRVEWMDLDRFQSTRSFLARYSDHEFSFTDCFSFTLMNDLSLRDALTKDAHFREAGFRPLLA
jgi:hypothetical protein